MKEYKIYMYWYPDVNRGGWLPYLTMQSNPDTNPNSGYKFTMLVKAENGSKAKNKSITVMNNLIKSINDETSF